MERVIQFVALITAAPPAALQGGDLQQQATDALLSWLLRNSEAADRSVRFRACQLLEHVITGLPESYELPEVPLR